MSYFWIYRPTLGNCVSSAGRSSPRSCPGSNTRMTDSCERLVEFGVADCIADRVGLAIPKSLEWQCFGKVALCWSANATMPSIPGKGRSNAGEKLIATLRLDEKSCRSRCQRFPAHNSIVVCSQDNDPGRR